MEYVEINTLTKTIRKFGDAENRQEAIDHVLSYNGLVVMSVESIIDCKGNMDRFMEDLALEDFVKLGRFKKEE